MNDAIVATAHTHTLIILPSRITSNDALLTLLPHRPRHGGPPFPPRSMSWSSGDDRSAPAQTSNAPANASTRHDACCLRHLHSRVPWERPPPSSRGRALDRAPRPEQHCIHRNRYAADLLLDCKSLGRKTWGSGRERHGTNQQKRSPFLFSTVVSSSISLPLACVLFTSLTPHTHHTSNTTQHSLSPPPLQTSARDLTTLSFSRGTSSQPK